MSKHHAEDMNEPEIVWGTIIRVQYPGVIDLLSQYLDSLNLFT